MLWERDLCQILRGILLTGKYQAGTHVRIKIYVDAGLYTRSIVLSIKIVFAYTISTTYHPVSITFLLPITD